MTKPTFGSHTVRGILTRYRKRRPSPTPPRANPVRIAVLEHDLLGIAPTPGTAAALAVALRRTGTCVTHQPIDVTGLADSRPNAICGPCGQLLVNTNGEWTLA
jgi:hypothetical protein